MEENKIVITYSIDEIKSCVSNNNNHLEAMASYTSEMYKLSRDQFNVFMDTANKCEEIFKNVVATLNRVQSFMEKMESYPGFQNYRRMKNIQSFLDEQENFKSLQDGEHWSRGDVKKDNL